MNVDGKAVADTLKEEIAGEAKGKNLSLVVFMMGEDPASRKFVERKQKFGKEVDIDVKVEFLSKNTSTSEFISKIEGATKTHQGVVVQLPLPEHIDARSVRNAIPATYDVDVLSDEAAEQFARGMSAILPPVVGAIKTLVEKHHIMIEGKTVTVIGRGRLVGVPVAIWFEQQGAKVKSVDRNFYSTDLSCRRMSYGAERADVIVLGAGSPELLKPDMIKQGVVIFDAGTSEAKGKLAGDADPACAEKASLFTPVPGGIGPITVAMIFKNLLELSRRRI